MKVVGCCNFCLREGFGDAYIQQVLRGKWDDWRWDWVYVDVSPYDRLSLPRSLTEPNKRIWESAPAEDARLRPVLNRIKDLRRAGLTSLMVVTNFLRRRLSPMTEHTRPA